MDNVTGGPGRNDITGNPRPNVLVGGQSNDVIRVVDGISGNDRVTGGIVTACRVQASAAQISLAA